MKSVAFLEEFSAYNAVLNRNLGTGWVRCDRFLAPVGMPSRLRFSKRKILLIPHMKPENAWPSSTPCSRGRRETPFQEAKQ